MIPRSRWTGLAGLAATNLVPLFLVWQGLLSTADLMVTFLIELLVLMVLWLPHGYRAFIKHSRKASDAWKVLPWLVVLVLLLAWVVLRQVTWDLTTVVCIVLGGAFLAVSTVLSVRRSESRVRFGALAWRIVLIFTGAVVGVGTAENYQLFKDTGWVPADLGSGWAYPFGRALIEAGLALGVPAVIIPAFFVVLVRFCNEVLYEAYDILRDADAEVSGHREALAAMHQQRDQQHRQPQHREPGAHERG